MEYFACILNRSFLVFITPDGLHCGKFAGPVSTGSPHYYEPIEALLDDPEFTPGCAEFKEIMSQPGSFFIARSQIRAVEFVAKSKLGMGPIPHSGKLYLRLRDGKKREFILLGSADGEAIRRMILAGDFADAAPAGNVVA
jgi:hypothetical protein